MIKQRIFKSLYLGVFCALGIFSCDNNDNSIDRSASLSLTFSHFWDNATLSSSDFNELIFTTGAGDLLSIERLRYLISDVQLVNANNQLTVPHNYNLVDVTNNQGLTFNLDDNLIEGDYRIQFTFGFNNEDNAGNYPDLNSINFNVPEMLGGGYHYMQLDGKFINSDTEEQGYNYHTIRAVDISSGAPVFPQDTFFRVDLGMVSVRNATAVEVRVNLAEWFKNPNTWKLNELSTILMPNPNAQILMYENGQSVFSLGDVTN